MKHKKRQYLYSLSIIFILAIVTCTMTFLLLRLHESESLNAYTADSDAFRSMDFSNNALEKINAVAVENNIDFTEAMAVFMTQWDFHLPEDTFWPTFLEFQTEKKLLEEKYPIELKKLQSAYKQIFDDLQVFPIPKNHTETADKSSWIVYEDSWAEKRTYGGERMHEGTDLMAENNTRGYYLVLSITDGTVENIGWLEKGGWRIGIKAPHGAYFYYAHLSDYFKEYKIGDTVKAGDILGFMGDSGYSKVEGTIGNFDVHLHMGIYLTTDLAEECSVNPYWILKYLEKNIIQVNMQE